MASFRSAIGFLFPFFMVIMTSLRMVDAHAGITAPPSMKVGNAFLRQCGTQASNIVKQQPFISQELWKARSSAGCQQRRCQGLFVEDQDLSKVQVFAPGQKIPVTIRVQVPHGGAAKLFLMDMSTGQAFKNSQGKDLVLQDLGQRFGTPQQNRIQTFSVNVPSEFANLCGKPGRCAIEFQWIVRLNNPKETYDICSLIAIGSK